MSDRAVLLIAYHFPPVHGSSGVQRTLRFAQYLPKFGWKPVVLTITVGAYERAYPHPTGNVPDGVEVYRAFGLDAARHLSVLGRYPRWSALPDRWASWRFSAVRMALRLIQQGEIRAIWSTFPIATAHTIGLSVAERTGIPWIAEFRDPMWQGDYPPDPRVNRSWQDLERRTFARADRAVLTTPSALSDYAERFPDYERSKLTLIENGYDEVAFAAVESELLPSDASGLELRSPIVLLHSGVIYPSERNPTQFFAAVAALKAKGKVTAGELQIRLRASGSEPHYRRILKDMGIDDIVRLEPPVGYAEALREMLTVDGLLLLQAANCNTQIPAKTYEYLRAGRPILALTDPSGDTASLLRSNGVSVTASLDSVIDIENAMTHFITQIAEKSWLGPSLDMVRRYSRETQTGHLACLLDELTESATRPKVS
jgi:glycosyltransferase involved in cell wall biosynthesis